MGESGVRAQDKEEDDDRPRPPAGGGGRDPPGLDKHISRAVNSYNEHARKVTDSERTNIEFEIRLRSLARDDFAKFLDSVEKKLKLNKPAQEKSVEAISSSRDEKLIRRIVYPAGKHPGRAAEEYGKKRNLVRVKIFPGGLPISLNVSEETSVDKSTAQLDRATLIRVKNRLRFEYPAEAPKWYVDVTISAHIPVVHQNYAKAYTSQLDETVKNMLLAPGDVDAGSMLEKVTAMPGQYNYEIEFEYAADSIESRDVESVLEVIGDALGAPKSNAENPAYTAELATVYRYLYGVDAQRSGPALSMKKMLPGVITLTRKKYRKIFPPTGYFATDKADGVRALAVLRGDRCLVLANGVTSYAVSAGPAAAGRRPLTILDGEYLKGDSIESRDVPGRFLAFDVIACRDEKTMSLPFAERLAKLPEAAAEFSCEGLVVSHKKFYELVDPKMLREQMTLLKKSTDKLGYNTDGVIFTEGGRGYLDTVSYKWKDIRNLTVDFLARRAPGAATGDRYKQKAGFDLYFLFVGISSAQMATLGLIPCPGYSELFPSCSTAHPGYVPIQFAPSTDPYAYLYWHSDELPSVDNAIVELRRVAVGADGGTAWEFVRVRTDKRGWPDPNPKTGSFVGVQKELCPVPEYNNAMVAEETWMLLLEEFEYEELYKPSGSYFAVQKEGVHKAHAAVSSMFKGTKIAEFAGSQWVVDMGVGQGQDLRRYMDANVANLVGVDADRTALSTLIERKYDLTHRSGMRRSASAAPAKPGSFGRSRTAMSIRLVCSDMADPAVIGKLKKVDLPDSGADLVVSNYSVSYNCSDLKKLRQFLTVCATAAGEDGAVVMTTFSGKKIFDALLEAGVDNGASWDLVENDVVKFSIRRRFESDTLLPARQKVETLLPFSGGEYYEEYLVNIDEIVSGMDKLGFSAEVREMPEFIAAQRKNAPEIIDQLSPADKQWLGFQIQLTFRRRDGGQTVGGGDDAPPNMWEISGKTNTHPMFEDFIQPATSGGRPTIADFVVGGAAPGKPAEASSAGGVRKGQSSFAYALMLLLSRTSGAATKRERYAVGACMMAQSIRATGGTSLKGGETADIVCMYTGTPDEKLLGMLGKFFDVVRKVPDLSCPIVSNISKSRFRDRYADWVNSAFTKLNCLTFTEYSKIVFLDADMLCLQNPSGIFEYDAPAGINTAITDQAAMDGKLIPFATMKKSLITYTNYGMSGGLYLLEPSTEKYNEGLKILSKCDEKHPYNTFEVVKNHFRLSGLPIVPIGPDEVFMTLLYPSWHHVSSRYGIAGWKRDKNTVIIHFVTTKPWDEVEKSGEPVYPDFEIWYEFAAKYMDKDPLLEELIRSGDHGEKILERIQNSSRNPG